VKKSAFLLSGFFLLLFGLELTIRRRAYADRGAWRTRPLPSPDLQATRIVVLGDSIAFGPDLAAEQAWPALLEQRLKHAYPDRRWQVINAGIPGNTTADAYARFDQHVRAYRPHLVLIALGLNDCRQVYRAIDRRRIAAFLRYENFAGTYGLGQFYLFRAILNHLAPLPEVDYSIQREADGPRVPPDTFSSLLDWFVNASKRMHAQPVLLSLTPISEALAPARRAEFARWSEYNTLVGRVAHKRQAPLIEVSHPFPDASYWAADGVHLSAAGETAVADRVWAGLQTVAHPGMRTPLHTP
jgi:lysophospholipase L1-like esterase